MISLQIFTLASCVLAVTSGYIAFYDDIPSFSFETVSGAQWGPWDICPFGELVTEYSYWYTENTGSVGVRLKCGDGTFHATSTAQKNKLRTQQSAACSGGFDGAQTTSSAINGIAQLKMRCSNDNAILAVPEPAGIVVPDTTESAIKTCSADHTVCGLRSKIDETVGLVAVEFLCCDKITSTVGDASSYCSFEESNRCNFDDKNFTTTNGLEENMFIHSDEVPYQSILNTGPTKGYTASALHDGSDYFMYYNSKVDSAFSQIQKLPGTKRQLKNVIANDEPTLRNMRYLIHYYAYGNQLGDLYFQILNEAGNVVQESLIYKTMLAVEQDLADAPYLSSQKWLEVNYPLYVNSTVVFRLAFEVKNGDSSYSQGSFAFDDLEYFYKIAGSCATTSNCHDNATCTDESNALGYTCTCNDGFIGTGANVTGGCVVINPCNEDPSLCLANTTANICTPTEPGNYTCACDDAGYKGGNNNQTCIDIDECSIPAWCGVGPNVTCNNTVGGFSCGCDAGLNITLTHAINSSLGNHNISCEVAGGWTAWAAPGGDYPCSVTCGGGVYNATRNCTNPAPSENGDYCVGPSYNETIACNTFDCPASCAVWKNCSTCENKTAFIENGPLNSSLTYFDGLSADDLTFAMTKMSQWNQTVIEEICGSSNCDVSKLNDSIAMLNADIAQINTLQTSVSSAKTQMRDILDCNPDTLTGHNEWLWMIFDKLCEYQSFLPHIVEDLNIKSGMLTAERDRCAGRGHLRQLLELMYRKW